MPSGTTVTIGRRWSSLDILIDAPEPYYGQVGPDDQHRQSEGLCGNFNGNPDDDFEHLSDFEFYNLHRYSVRNSHGFIYFSINGITWNLISSYSISVRMESAILKLLALMPSSCNYW